MPDIGKDDGVIETPVNDLVLTTSDSLGDIPNTSCCLDTIYCETMGFNRIDRIFGRRHSSIPSEQKSRLGPSRTTKTKSNRHEFHRSVSLGGEPRVHESIECVIAKQQNDELPQPTGSMNDMYNNDEWQSRIVAPSGLHQSLIRNRLYPTLSNPSYKEIERTASKAKAESLSRKDTRRTRIETKHPCDSNSDELPNLASISDRSGDSSSSISTGSVVSPSKAQHCACSQCFSPVFKSALWPQRPLLLRPTPNST